jgi:hypothetical protein
MKGTVQGYFDRAFDEMTDKELETPLANSGLGVKAKLAPNSGTFVQFRKFGDLALATETTSDSPKMYGETEEPSASMVVPDEIFQVSTQDLAGLHQRRGAAEIGPGAGRGSFRQRAGLRDRRRRVRRRVRPSPKFRQRITTLDSRLSTLMEVSMSENQIYAQAVRPGNALIDITVGGVEYIAEAPRHTAATAAAWACYAVFPVGTAGRRIKHAAGLHAPGENGEHLADLTYA